VSLSPRPADHSIASTLQHIGLVAAKRRQLQQKQLDAETQLLTVTAREWRYGNLTLDELIDIYVLYRADADPGFSKRWTEIVPISAIVVTGAITRRRLTAAELPEPETGWLGPFPLDQDVPAPRKGICVVYVLFDAMNTPCYVGSTQHLRSRLKAHAKDGKQFVRWQARSCPTRHEAYALERRWLAEFMPYLNKRSA
jgi:hypothetical protein